MANFSTLRVMELTRVNGDGWDPTSEDAPAFDDAQWSDIVRGVPVRALCRLAKDCGNKRLWINVSHNAAGTGDAAVATYAQAFIAELEDELPQDYEVIIESPGNESCFNTIFQSCQDFQTRGGVLFNTGDAARDGARYAARKAIQWAQACQAAETGKLRITYVLGAFVADNQVNDELRTYELGGVKCEDVYGGYAVAPYILTDFGQTNEGNYGLQIIDDLETGLSFAVDAMFVEANTRIAGFASDTAATVTAWASTGMDVYFYEGPSPHIFLSLSPINLTTNTDFHEACQAFVDDPRMFALTQAIVNAVLPLCTGVACYYTLAGQTQDPVTVGVFGALMFASSSVTDPDSPIFRALVDLATASTGGVSGGNFSGKVATNKVAASKLRKGKV